MSSFNVVVTRLESVVVILFPNNLAYWVECMSIITILIDVTIMASTVMAKIVTQTPMSSFEL